MRDGVGEVIRADVAVVGSGPAGIAAAVEAAGAGRSVVLLDSSPRVGGQIWRHRERSELPPVARMWLDRLDRSGARVLAARMRLTGGPAAGYVLTLRDITGEMAAEARREAMLEAALDSLRRPSAALSTLVGVMPDAALPDPLQAALKDEVARLAQAVTRFGSARAALP